MERKPPGAGVSPAQRLASLDAVRGVASLLVLLYHLDDVMVTRGVAVPFGGLGHGGARGVDCLFVLSGYVMGRLFLREGARKVTPGIFLWQRAQRLLPAFWLVCIAALALYLLGVGGAEKAAKLVPWRLAASFLLLPQDMPPLVNVSWFLVYEAFFYVLIAVALFDRRLGFAAMLLWQGAIVAMLVAGHPFPPAEIPGYLNPRALGLGVGLLAALFGLRAERAAPLGLLRPAFAAAAVLLLADMAWEGSGQRDRGGVPIILLDVAAAVLILSATAIESRGGWKPPPLLVRLGLMSYSVYLTHFATLTFAAALLARLGVGLGNVAALFCAALALAVGACLHHGLDAPLQAAFRRSRGRRRPQPAGATLSGMAPQAGG